MSVESVGMERNLKKTKQKNRKEKKTNVPFSYIVSKDKDL